jgi:hypothetical protein
MSADDRLQHRGAPLLQGRERANLVRLHEAAVADHVGHQHGGQAAFHDLASPLASPYRRRARQSMAAAGAFGACAGMRPPCRKAPRRAMFGLDNQNKG